MTYQSKQMNILLWIAQSIMAASFIWAGAMKLFKPAEQLALMWPWTAEHPLLVKFTGVLDILAGIGLIVPTLLKIQPKLTVYTGYAAIGLMISASIFHVARGEAALIGINVFYAILAFFIAWGRNKQLR
ncbi:MAG TPA: hypothetical protein DCM71_05065 [Runella sp.]|nr:hypothetical protein [Runella sp.]